MCNRHIFPMLPCLSCSKLKYPVLNPGPRKSSIEPTGPPSYHLSHIFSRKLAINREPTGRNPPGAEWKRPEGRNREDGVESPFWIIPECSLPSSALSTQRPNHSANHLVTFRAPSLMCLDIALDLVTHSFMYFFVPPSSSHATSFAIGPKATPHRIGSSPEGTTSLIGQHSTLTLLNLPLLAKPIPTDAQLEYKTHCLPHHSSFSTTTQRRKPLNV